MSKSLFRIDSLSVLALCALLAALAPAPSWSGNHGGASKMDKEGKHHHGKKGHKKGAKRGARFSAPGVMEVVLKHADDEQRDQIKKLQGSFEDAKEDMAKLKSAGDASKADLKEARAKIKEARKGLSSVVKQVAKDEDAAAALRKVRNDTRLARFFMHHEDQLSKFSESMSDGGEEFAAAILANRDKLKEHRAKMKEFTPGKDYGKFNETRAQMRKIMESQQKLVRDALNRNPNLRDKLFADYKEIHKNKRGKKGKRGKGDGECDAGE